MRKKFLLLFVLFMWLANNVFSTKDASKNTYCSTTCISCETISVGPCYECWAELSFKVVCRDENHNVVDEKICCMNDPIIS